ncbi:MAG TPA: hypothetical protein VGD50_01955 [Candidatus Baltobacteraceae bacterium]
MAGLLAFAALAIVSHLKATSYNNYVLLADAFLHRRIWIDWPGPYIDALGFEGSHYVIEAPMPALLLMPLVALYGTAANQTLLSVVLGGLSVGLAWEIARRLGVPLIARAWLCAFLLLGTDLFWCAMLGDVWFIAHVSAMAFTLAALLELLGKRRAWLVAIYAVCALESRFPLVLALPVYAALLATDPAVNRRWRNLAVFTASLLPFVALWIAYNEVRWHTPYDIGYTAWYHLDTAGEPTGSPFRLSYLPYQLQSFFVQRPDFVAYFPFLVPTYGGVALTWTSPALLLAFLAWRPERWVIAMWAATLAVAAPSFVYYVNGFSQFGMRHALDFEAFLFVLMALGMRRRMPWYGVVLCAYSVVVGMWGVWFWLTYYRQL